MGRAPNEWTDASVRLIREHFVAVVVPTEVCRAKTPEGEFLRAAGIDKHWVTSAGYMSCVSASGKYLGEKPTEKVLAAFRALPEGERKAGAIEFADLTPEQRLIPSPPLGGLVLRVHGRFMSRDGAGALCHTTGADFPQFQNEPDELRAVRCWFEPNVECMWLTEEEWKSLVPAKGVVGEGVVVWTKIAERMARFHLCPRRALTSEDGILRKEEVKSAWLSLVVDEVKGDRVRMRMTGQVHTGSPFDGAKATTPNGPLAFGFATEIHGVLEYDRGKGAFTRFDLIAPGEVWGRWGDANGKSLRVERPGKSPIGFAFELATGDSPTNRIPPGGNGERALRNDYFGTGEK